MILKASNLLLEHQSNFSCLPGTDLLSKLLPRVRYFFPSGCEVEPELVLRPRMPRPLEVPPPPPRPLTLIMSSVAATFLCCGPCSSSPGLLTPLDRPGLLELP